MATEDGELFTFATSSRGGITAVGKLSTLYGRHCAKHRDEFPVVELGVGTYLHANKAYGRIKFPEFTVVGWTSKSTFDRALAAAGLTDAYGGEPDDAQPIDDGDSIPF
jgi:hypothetical protein